MDFVGSFLARVDLSDEQYVKKEKERYIKPSVTPFREPRDGPADKDEEDEEGERPPEWLELAGDLAWTATFSSLTSNTSITDPVGIGNYAVFFFLAWHLWATQVAYDIRYYTNDWFHRILFALQLAVYAVLAAYSDSFNVGWKITSDATDVFKGNVTQLTGQAMDDNQEHLITKSFRYVNMILFISRMILVAQYMRVMAYRKHTKEVRSWRFHLAPLVIGIAGFIFLGCFFMIREGHGSKIVAILQLVLWGVAVLLQVFGGALIPKDHEGALKRESPMAPRLITLTVIILGEGLNGICATLRHNMNSLGFSKTMAGQLVAILCIFFFIWLFYFDGFRVKYSPHKPRVKAWVFYHFWLHLNLILVLESIKNLFIYVSILDSRSRLDDAFDEVRKEYQATMRFPEHPKLEKLLRVLNMSWQQEKNDLQGAIDKDADPSGNMINVASQIWRWWGEVVHNAILLYNEEKDPKAEYHFDNLIYSNDTAIAEDFLSDDKPLVFDFYDLYLQKMASTGYCVVIFGGLLLYAMAVINSLQSRPRNRFVSGYNLTRGVLGAALWVIAILSASKIEEEGWAAWILPSMAFAYGIGVGVDWVILHFCVQSIRNMESLSPQLPPLPYDHEQSQQLESSPAGTDIQGQKGSSDLVDAAGREKGELHREKSESSFV